MACQSPPSKRFNWVFAFAARSSKDADTAVYKEKPDLLRDRALNPIGRFSERSQRPWSVYYRSSTTKHNRLAVEIMMDESIQMNLADSLQLNCKLDNPSSCLKIPRLKTVSAFDMSKPGAWKARESLYRQLCRSMAGRVSLEQTELYTDLLSLWQGQNNVQTLNRRDGCYYWGRSISAWAKKYGCSERHFKWLLKGLRDRQLVATCVMKKPGNKLHVRPLVAAGSACLSGWPDSHNFAHLLKSETQTQQGPQTEKCPNAGGQKVSECPSAESVPAKKLVTPCSASMDKSDPVQASPVTKANPEMSPELPGKIQVKSETLNPPPGGFDDPKFSTVVDAWVSNMRELWPAHTLPLLTRSPKQLRDARNRLEADGIDWRAFLDVIMQPCHWRAACGHATACPSVDYMAGHLPEFVAWYRQNNPETLAASAAAEEQAKAAAHAQAMAEQALKFTPAKLTMVQEAALKFKKAQEDAAKFAAALAA